MGEFSSYSRVDLGKECDLTSDGTLEKITVLIERKKTELRRIKEMKREEVIVDDS